MTVPAEDSYVRYTNQTGTGPFAFTFTVFEKDDLEVRIDGVALATSAWTIVWDTTDTGGYTGGSITLNSSVTTATVDIVSIIPAVRGTDFGSGALSMTSLNTEFDKLTAILRDLQRDVARTPRVDLTETTADLGKMADNAGKAIAVNSGGTALEYVTVAGGHDAVTLAGSYNYLTLSGQEITLGQVDLATDVAITSEAQGDILYRGASAWSRLAAGTNGQVLTLSGGVPAWAAASGSGDMLAATYDPASVSEQLVGLTASQTLTNKTLTQPVITLEQGISVAPTAEGRIAWDTDDNKLKVGDGASTKTFSDDAYNASTYAAASHTHAASDINSGTLVHERGGLEADVSAYSGLIKISGGATSQVTDNSANWDTAYGWGDHSTAGYLTAITGESIGSLSDVTITTPDTGALLYYNGAAWIDLAAGSAGQYLEGGATPSWSTPSGSGDVSKVGTPVNNQIGVWTGDGTIEGDAALTFDTTTDTLAIGASGALAFGAVTVLDDSAGTTTLQNIDALDPTTEGTIEAAIDTLANLTAAASLATVGTLTTGTWNATAIGTQYGGTGQNFSASTGIVKITSGTASVITDNSANWDTAFGWGDHSTQGYLTSVALNDVSDVTITTGAQGDILYRNATGWVNLPAGTNGYFLKTQGAAANPVWASIGGGGDMLASTYDPASISEQLVGLTASQTLTNKTLTQPTLTLKQGISAAPTAEGDIQWDTDDNKLKVGDGAATKTFSDDTYVLARANHTGTQAMSTISDAGALATLDTVDTGQISITSEAQGDILIRGLSGWQRLAAGTSGYVLSTQGAGANPQWVAQSGGGDMSASTYDPAAIAEQLVGLTASQTLTNKTLTQPILTLEQGISVAPTAEGRIAWDTDDNKLKVGDGVGTKTFSDDSYNASTYAASSHTHAASDIVSGTLTHERGGLEADVSAYSGLLKISGGVTSQVTDNSSNWDTAFGWGNHASAGYLTSVALNDVSDVTITTVASGEVLKWSGTAWINNTLAEAGIAAASHTHTLSDITDAGSIASQAANNVSITGGAISGAAITLVQSLTPAPTAEGVVEWDTDNNQFKVGDGVGTKTFSSDADISITESQISDLGAYITGITAESIGSLSDVTLTTPADASFLIYDTGTGQWRDAVFSGDVTVTDTGVATVADNSHSHLIANISDFTDNSANWDTAFGWGNHASAGYLTTIAMDGISDVTITTVAAGEVLKWSGTAWINNTLAEAGIAADSHNHSGVYQPLDSTLTSIAALGTAADKFAYTTGIDTWAEAAITSAGRALLDDASASAQRTTLGLGALATLSTIDTSEISITSEAQGDVLIRGASGWERLGTGTAGQVLQANGAGANPSWEDSSATEASELTITVANNTGSTISARKAVHFTTWDATAGAINVVLADANASKPANGFTKAGITTGSTGTVVVRGKMSGGDWSAYTDGDPLYLSTTPGEVTATKPTGAGEIVQRLGYVIYNNNLGGQIFADVTDPLELDAIELAQLENIGSNAISATEWGYLAAQNQQLATTDSPTFAGLTLTSPLAVAQGGIGATSLSAAGIVETSRTLTGGTGIGTIGDLSANRTVNLDFTGLGTATALTTADVLVVSDAGASGTMQGRTLGNMISDLSILTTSDINASVQAQGAVLDDLNTLGASTAGDQFLVSTGVGVLAWESGATARGSLGLGSIATQASSSVSITGGSMSGVAITLVQGLTPAPTAEGVIEWDTDNNQIKVGDGVGTKTFSDDSQLSPVAGSASITTVGTLTTGTWQGTAVASGYGGTGQDFSASSGIVKFSTGTASVVTAPTGTIVGTSDTQTLTNKTIDSATNTLTVDLTEATVTGTMSEFNTAVSDGTFLYADAADQTITGGANVTVLDQGTKSTGTYTLDYGARPIQRLTNGGAFTLAPDGSEGTLILHIINNASAGAITTSGWTIVDGDAFTTTNAHEFLCYCVTSNNGTGDKTVMTVKALQ